MQSQKDNFDRRTDSSKLSECLKAIEFRHPDV